MTGKRSANLALWEPSAVLAMIERRIAQLPWQRERLRLERRLVRMAEVIRWLSNDVANAERALA